MFSQRNNPYCELLSDYKYMYSFLFFFTENRNEGLKLYFNLQEGLKKIIMKRIVGLDLGTNSIGWSLIDLDFKNKKGEILGLGSRIIPMDAKEMGKFDAGQTISQTADRTGYRGTRRLYQRDSLRRERLHRVLNVLNFLPKHYSNSIDFIKKLGQFKPDTEVKLPFRKNDDDAKK